MHHYDVGMTSASLASHCRCSSCKFRLVRFGNSRKPKSDHQVTKQVT
ncbi:Uncharacterised protein [Vibrio cholerae]|nr:Uncharacterised protein [Vibrio cholerae]